MGTQFLNVNVGRCLINYKNRNSTMFRFVALFALVAVAFAEPEADAQWLVNPYNTVAGVPVVNYVDPHHTEGMTEQGVPEKTDSVKIAEKQHEVAQAIENAKAKVQYVAPYTTYGYPYVHPVGHYIAKREADSESDPYVVYNTHHAGAVYPYGTTYGTPYAYNYGYPYTYNNAYTYGIRNVAGYYY